MTKKEFLISVTNDRVDIIQQLLDLLKKMKIDYCVIGGLAVNAYAEPVVSLDLDLVIITDKMESFLKKAKELFTVEQFTHSINLHHPKSDLRVQIQTDPLYQGFIPRSSLKEVMGYKMKIADIKDVLQGKIWAYSDKERRKSKRQKDLADISRLIEKYPELKNLLPESMKDTDL